MQFSKQIWQWSVSLGLSVLLLLQLGCAQLQLPRIDPSGNRIFLPGTTPVLAPGSPSGATGSFGPNSGFGSNPGFNPGFQNNAGFGSNFGANPLRSSGSPIGAFQPPSFNQPGVFGQTGVPPQATLPQTGLPPAAFPQNTAIAGTQLPPASSRVSPAMTQQTPNYPTQPAFQHPATPPPCNQQGVKAKQVKHVIPKPTRNKKPGQTGELIMTPSRIVAPVGSEVVVLAGICGGDGYLVKNQPLEWMLSNNSVGEIIEVGGTSHHTAFNRLVPPTARKFDGQYAYGRTGLKNTLLSRGTPTPVDDIELQEGQTYISVASASPGTTYVTGVAPKAEGWDRRRSSTTIHWVDGQWSIPVPARATAGTVYPLTTVVSRASDAGGVEDWKVRYSIVGGAPAEFAPTGSQTVETKTDREGNATVQLRQLAGQFEPGTTQIRVEVIRPSLFGEPELMVESGITSVTWSAPALTIRAIGPRETAIDQPFNYRVEVTNPGDQIARGVVVRTKNLDDGIEFISSNPKPTEYGRQFEWKLGDIAPGSPSRIIDIQMKSKKRGNVGMCYEVASDEDRLRTEACAETEVAAPCLSLNVDGPTTANVGDKVTFILDIQNECEETLEDLELKIQYESGLNRPGRANPSKDKMDQLQYGESQPMSVEFDVVGTGEQCFEISITAKGGYPPVRERRCIQVGQRSQDQLNSQVGLEILGGEPVEVGGSTLVELRVTNRGNTPIQNAVLTNRFSSSVEPTFISQEFEDATWEGDEIAVFIGTINPGQTVPVQIEYVGRTVDGNATSEYSVTSPSGANAADQINLRVQPVGSLQNGGQNDRGGQNGRPAQPDFGNNGLRGGDGGANPGSQGVGGGDSGLGSGQVRIPRDPVREQGGLIVDVRNLDSNIQVFNTNQPNPNTPSQARIEFVVKNNRQTTMRDVDITVAVPEGLKLTAFDYGDTALPLENRNENFTEFYIRRRNELRAGEELKFTAVVQTNRPGIANFDVRVKSTDLIGTATGRDAIVISE